MNRLLSRFLTDDRLRHESQTVLTTKMKPGETGIAFVEGFHSPSLRFRNDFIKSKLVNCYKQRLPESIRSMLENNILSIALEISQYLDRVKSYSLNASGPLFSITTVLNDYEYYSM